ncbi:MAG: cytochrome C [Betaproteobacteria bacterium]
MRHWRWRLALGLTAAWLAGGAAGQALEGVLMPGKVIAGHAKLEQDCAKCHVKFNKAAQDGLCLDCHKETAADVRAKQGYHGRLKIESCKSCHTDHKGPDVNIAAFDPKAFEHAKTDFALLGAHPRVECKACHLVGKKYRQAPGGCNDCHRKDDKHKAALGVLCADCHTQASWKDARFDHAKTRFALVGKHVPTACKDCHANNVFKGAPTTCVGCHRKDDKQHHGKLGDKCEACHNATDWKDVGAFRHDRETKYPLRGRHATTKCEACHTVAAPVVAKTATTCIGCHEKDDKHRATLGTACADCHTERNWKEAKYDHDLSAFKLRGKHKDVECKDCHRDPKSYKGTPQTCIGCHRKDDTHKDRYGDKCASCHTDRTWKDIVFRHERDTKYALTGKHATTKCDACHTGHVYRDKLGTDCFACHRKDDKHKDQLGRRCEDCHETADWKKTLRFDHNRSKFPLLGRHARVLCKDCHATPAYKDAKTECIACHAKDDKHKRMLGIDCAACHNARDWKLWDFDHRKTRFALDGAHLRAACVTCHKAPADKVPPLPVACIECHRNEDVHDGEFGPLCQRCHTARSWKDVAMPASRAARPPREVREPAGVRP